MGPDNSAPSGCDVVGADSSNGPATHPLFVVIQKTKNVRYTPGVYEAFHYLRLSSHGEARQLELSDVSPLFGLCLPDAADQLGMSRSTLKKACRFLGLNRWPGRKVRVLESTIDGLERALAGQGADSEAAGMRSKISKLQQELDELYHGTPAQINARMNPPEAKAKKRKQNPALCTEGPLAKKPKAGKERIPSTRPMYIRPCVSVRRFLRACSRLGFRESGLKVSDLEGLLPEVDDVMDVAGCEVGETVVLPKNGDNMLIPKIQIGEEGTKEEKVEGELKDVPIFDKLPESEVRCLKCSKIVAQGQAHFVWQVKVEPV